MEYLIIFFGLMVVLFAIGVPIAVGIGLTCLEVLVIRDGITAIPAELFAIQMLRGLNNFPSPRTRLPELLRLFGHALPPLMTPLIIVGGIWSGIFTPTESGVIACLHALFLGGVVYRELTWRGLMGVLANTVRFSSIILFIIGIATFYGWLLLRLRLPQELWHDCVAEGLRLILTLDGVKDDEETLDDEGAC